MKEAEVQVGCKMQEDKLGQNKLTVAQDMITEMAFMKDKIVFGDWQL